MGTKILCSILVLGIGIVTQYNDELQKFHLQVNKTNFLYFSKCHAPILQSVLSGHSSMQS